MAHDAARFIDDAIKELKAQANEILSQIGALEKARVALGGAVKSIATRRVGRPAKKVAKKAPAKGRPGRKKVTAKERAEISRRMKAYWAARRKGKGAGKAAKPAAKKVAKKAASATKKAAPATKKAAQPKRKYSPAARKALSERMKAKWAAYRATKPAASKTAAAKN